MASPTIPSVATARMPTKVASELFSRSDSRLGWPWSAASLFLAAQDRGLHTICAVVTAEFRWKLGATPKAFPAFAGGTPGSSDPGRG